MKYIGAGNQTRIAAAMGHEPPVNPTGMDTRGRGTVRLPRLLSPIPFSTADPYIDAISPQSDHGFWPSEMALGQKTLVFFGLSR
ncbi:hypothetical protein [Mesorhizobium sp. ES1-4]|uniref:hypothetical protein n=1 Tax=Mesorhizobium sp. ES1-4 TaxID=2876627 RepID=UPI001CCBAEB2|nr:hypothetical protein [Mesorhizobium sp. ES1-4]MBZ9794155.1 hypothetical protein [Mesorhizobium sp. ES1-4]